MKVRLKPAPLAALIVTDCKFQFHEGPIKTLAFIVLLSKVLSFNSMKVRLKLVACTLFRLLVLSFNSMKVRLKREPPP